MHVIIPSGQLTSALAACVAHTYQGKDAGYLATVDLQTGDDLKLVATASGGTTTGVAIIDMVEFDGTMGRVALSRQDIATIRTLFTDPLKQLEIILRSEQQKPSSPDDRPETVYLMEIRELGALFGGKAVKLTMPDHGNRDVAGLWHPIAVALQRRGLPPLPITKIHPKEMNRFRAASFAYEQELRIEPASKDGSLLVHCGDSFIGLLVATAELTDSFTNSRTGWANRLPRKFDVVRTEA